LIRGGSTTAVVDVARSKRHPAADLVAGLEVVDLEVLLITTTLGRNEPTDDPLGSSPLRPQATEAFEPVLLTRVLHQLADGVAAGTFNRGDSVPVLVVPAVEELDGQAKTPRHASSLTDF
jgi:hypothetical protein